MQEYNIWTPLYYHGISSPVSARCGCPRINDHYKMGPEACASSCSLLFIYSPRLFQSPALDGISAGPKIIITLWFNNAPPISIHHINIGGARGQEVFIPHHPQFSSRPSWVRLTVWGRAEFCWNRYGDPLLTLYIHDFALAFNMRVHCEHLRDVICPCPKKRGGITCRVLETAP